MNRYVIDIGAAFAEVVKPFADKIDALAAEVAQLREQRTAEVLDSTSMASKFGKPSTEAFTRWISRKGGEHIKAISKVDPAGRRYWLRAEVDALTTRGAR